MSSSHGFGGWCKFSGFVTVVRLTTFFSVATGILTSGSYKKTFNNLNSYEYLLAAFF
jgi:hypothetical protein